MAGSGSGVPSAGGAVGNGSGGVGRVSVTPVGVSTMALACGSWPEGPTPVTDASLRTMPRASSSNDTRYRALHTIDWPGARQVGHRGLGHQNFKVLLDDLGHGRDRLNWRTGRIRSSSGGHIDDLASVDIGLVAMDVAVQVTVAPGATLADGQLTTPAVGSSMARLNEVTLPPLVTSKAHVNTASGTNSPTGMKGRYEHPRHQQRDRDEGHTQASKTT
jgi:hypothetical protein